MRGTGLELTREYDTLCRQIPEGAPSTGFLQICRAISCREVLHAFIPIRLKIRPNFIAAWDVPIPLDNESIYPTEVIKG